MILFLGFGSLLLLVIIFVVYSAYKRNMHIWIISYIINRIKIYKIRKQCLLPIHIMFCFVDHFEPPWNGADYDTEIKRVKYWLNNYPELIKDFYDSDGNHPKHTFFFPEEEYRSENIEMLKKLVDKKIAEIEVHLHHDNDTSEKLTEKLERFKKILAAHGVLPIDKDDNKVKYGFIHGNWALDNSRKDGKWCGVNDEISILFKTNCYADFSLPTAPSETQTKKINSIYYATDDPLNPKSHNTGIDLRLNGKKFGDLLIIQGPLTLNWKNRKLAFLPRIEACEINYQNFPTKHRVDLWVKTHLHVTGKPNWIFIKVYTHGTQERNRNALFGNQIKEMHSYLTSKYNDGIKYKLHYVSAREMYNIIKAAENGETGNPNVYRDYKLVYK